MIATVPCTISIINDASRSLNDAYSGLYYKPIMTINDESSIINKLEISLIDDARVVIYDRHMFIVQATGA
jgi:hypothetical protein